MFIGREHLIMQIVTWEKNVVTIRWVINVRYFNETSHKMMFVEQAIQHRFKWLHSLLWSVVRYFTPPKSIEDENIWIWNWHRQWWEQSGKKTAKQMTTIMLSRNRHLPQNGNFECVERVASSFKFTLRIYILFLSIYISTIHFEWIIKWTLYLVS